MDKKLKSDFPNKIYSISFSKINHLPKSKNLKYYPKTENNSFQDEHIKYLANDNNYNQELYDKNIPSKKNIKRRNKKNKNS